MTGVRPDHALWSRVNQVCLGENAATVLVTFISGMCALLKASGACEDEEHARVHLAAVLLSPDDGRPAGSLVPLLQAEFERLKDGRTRQ